MSGLEQYQATARQSEGGYNPRDPDGGTLAGFYLRQYKELNPAIRTLADVKEHDILDQQARWWRERGGNALEAKYGPEFAASYVESSC
jgi:lysozyme family protein